MLSNDINMLGVVENKEMSPFKGYSTEDSFIEIETESVEGESQRHHISTNPSSQELRKPSNFNIFKRSLKEEVGSLYSSVNLNLPSSVDVDTLPSGDEDIKLNSDLNSMEPLRRAG